MPLVLSNVVINVGTWAGEERIQESCIRIYNIISKITAIWGQSCVDTAIRQSLLIIMPVTNVNVGEQGLVRQSINRHCQTCMLEVISCECAHVGCESTMTRQQMLKHMVSYQGKHLDTITQSHPDAKEKQTIVLKELEVAKTELWC